MICEISARVEVACRSFAHDRRYGPTQKATFNSNVSQTPAAISGPIISGLQTAATSPADRIGKAFGYPQCLPDCAKGRAKRLSAAAAFQ